MNSIKTKYMATLFAQTITQFANLRVYAQISTTISRKNMCTFRNLFPKALFDEQTTYECMFAVAWSFLSPGEEGRWVIEGKYHRIGGLPAVIYTCGSHEWWYDRKYHRVDKDPRTGLTLPATVVITGTRFWYQSGQLHRIDKDLRTGLTLPAVIRVDETYAWYKDGNPHRNDKDPRTGSILPAIIRADGRREYWINVIPIC